MVEKLLEVDFSIHFVEYIECSADVLLMESGGQKRYYSPAEGSEVGAQEQR